MNIFKPFTMQWWQVVIFKLSLASFGIIVGVYFHDFFLAAMPLVAVFFVVTVVYLARIWWSQISRS